jgi:hypothetical protein
LRRRERDESRDRLAAARDHDVFARLVAHEKLRKPCLGLQHIELLSHIDQV